MKSLSLVVMLALPAFAFGQPSPSASARQASPSRVEAVPEGPVTLDEAIAQELANSRRLAEIQARVEAADFAVAGRHAAEMPLVAVQGGYVHTNHVDYFAI